MGSKWKLLLSLSLLISQVSANFASNALMMEKCLAELSTPETIAGDLKKLERYPLWTREELPCLLRCLASEKGWFDIQANQWKFERLTDDLGPDVYNYCRFELRRQASDGCTFVYRGLRCLKQAELHAGTSQSTLLQCSRQLNATNEKLLQYSKLKSEEAIPCLFQCFADAMGLYNFTTGDWRLSNWHQAFGPTRNGDQPSAPGYSGCRLNETQRGQAANKCAWMYQEYRCWERINGYDLQPQDQDAS